MNKIKSTITFYLHHYFVRNVAILQIGNMAGNIIQAVVGIFLARILQPELYGVYALAFSLASLLSILLGSGVQDAMVNVMGRTFARNEHEETRLALAFMLKMAVLLGLATLIIALTAPVIADKIYHNSTIGIYALVIILASIVSNSFLSIVVAVFQVTGKIRAMMLLGLSDQAIRSGLSLVLVAVGLGVAGAVSGHLIGALILLLGSLMVWNKLRKGFPNIVVSLKKLILQAQSVPIRKYLSFSVWVAWDKNVANLYSILPVLLIGIFVAKSEVTFFKLAFSYLNLALGLLAPISILLNAEFSKILAVEPFKLIRSFVKVTLYSVGISLVITLGAVAVSPWLFKFLYGEAFLPSVKYVYALVLYGASMGLGVALGPMWRALNKVGISILINAIVLSFGIPLGLFLISRWGSFGAIIMVTVWFLVSHIVSLVYITRCMKNTEI